MSNMLRTWRRRMARDEKSLYRRMELAQRRAARRKSVRRRKAEVVA